MNLSEKYINKLMSLAGLLNENRIEKLRAEKYPEEIINFAINFAKETTRNSSDENNVSKNQYIPWIASQAKSQPGIMKDVNKLNTIISWIKNSGYNKINSTENFNDVYEKSKEWLKAKNINLLSGERIEGGKVVKKYENGFHWIQATEVNWCINAGEQYGWCFNQLNRAEQFVGLGDIGLNNKGYFLLNNEHKPIIALQYNSKTKQIEDIQGTHNTPLNAQLLPYAFDLFKLLPQIIDIKGHQDSFWQSFNFEGGKKFKEELLKMPNVSFTTFQKLIHKLPLTKDEISSLSIEDKINYGYVTEAELATLPIHKKIEHDVHLTKDDLAKINQPILKKIEQVIKKKFDPRDLFVADQNNLLIKKDFEGFKDFYVDEDAINISIDENEYDKKYSGLDEYNRYFQHYTGDDEEVDDSELEYMKYHLNEENLEKIKELATLLGVSHQYDFEETDGIHSFLEENIQNHQEIFDNYTLYLGYAIGNAKEKSIQDTLKKEQIFKYTGGFLVLPWRKIYKFIKEHPITKFKELEDLEINGEIDLQDIAYNYNNDELDEERIKRLNDAISSDLYKSLEYIESNPGYSENVDEFQDIIRNLKFEKGEFTIYASPKNGMMATNRGSAFLKLELPKKTIFIQDVDYSEKKISVFIIEYEDKKKKKTKKMSKGKIQFDNLTNYTHNYSLFENEIRKAVRKILFEGGNFRRSDINDNEVATFVPSREVIQTAQRALQVTQNNKLVQADASNEGSGLQKANSLINAEPMTHAQLKRMQAFFANNSQAVGQEKGAGRNINNSPIIQKWELWGGDAGKNWAEQQISSQKSSNETSKKLRNPEHGVDTKTLMNPHNTRIHK